MLRALALIAVTGVHLFIFLGLIHSKGPVRLLGQFAVLLFLVHTCLVLMYSLERIYAGGGWRRLFNHFILRRGFRLYPLSILIVLVVYFFNIPAADFRVGQLLPVHVDAVGLWSNIVLVQNLTYSPYIVAQLWSLPFEIQMYLLLPTLFLLASRSKSTRAFLLMWIGAVAFALVQPAISDRLSIAQYIPCFLPGVIAYQAAKSPRARPPLPAFLWPLLLIGLGAAYTFTEPYEHGWGLCLIAGWTVTQFREVQLSWVKRVAHALAKYSYGVYLTHMIAIWVAFIELAKLPRAVQWSVFVVILVGLPVLLYQALEAPLTRFGASLAQRWYPASHRPPRQLPELDETTPQTRAQLHALQLPAAATK